MGITFRNTKGSALTHTEMDNNFREYFYSASVDAQSITFFKSQSLDPGTTYTIYSVFARTGSAYSATSDIQITGSLEVKGDVTATRFNTQIVSASVIYESGSTKFGDTTDDTHEFTGSLLVTGSLKVTGSVELGTPAQAVLNVTGEYVYLPKVFATSYADDIAAAAGNVPIGGLYRNGNFIQIRLT